MRLWPGTSGYSYAQWVGPFYPDKLAKSRMLGYYGTQLPTVEINNTFYRMPKAEVLSRWATEVPKDFRFVLKAPQRITHKERLVDSGASLEYFWKNASTLGGLLGPILFQLPPFLRCDMDRLRSFLTILPGEMKAAFEFRHGSWDQPAVTEMLTEYGCAKCVADADEGDAPPITATADWGYLRLRRAQYQPEALRDWVARIREQSWQEVFVFFKHEDDGVAPSLAGRLRDAFIQGGAA